MDITPFFKLMVEKNASDLFLSVGATPFIKIEGILSALSSEILKSKTMSGIVAGILTNEQLKEFEKNLELNIGLSLPGIGRFRLNFFRQRGEVAIVARYIKGDIPTLESLHLPIILQSIMKEVRGLILVVGSTGSGKSTTLASMIDYRNSVHRGHILTIEDPIEFLYRHKLSIVDQREVGINTLSYDNALKNASTMKHAITYAQTGHLCLSTLHANNANQALERIINFFPESARMQLLSDLALNLKAIISSLSTRESRKSSNI